MNATDNPTASKAKRSVTDNDPPCRTPAAKQDLASRPIKVTPADVVGHLPETRLRPEFLAVLGGMLDVFDQLHADGCPVQLSPEPAKPADDLRTDHATLPLRRKPADSSERAQGGRTTNFSAATNPASLAGRGDE
jgi:hypothetical protein